MPFLRALHPGIAYGLGRMESAGTEGQFVQLTSNNGFSVVSSGNQIPFGILRKTYVAGDMPGVFCGGGIYETDQFTGTPTPGNVLTVNGQGILAADGQPDDQPAAQVIAVNGNVLRFKLLV